MVNRRFAEKFAAFHKRDWPVDVHFQHPQLFGNFKTYGVEPCPVMPARGASSINAIGRPGRSASRLHRQQCVARGMYHLKEHGLGLRIRFWLRLLSLKITASRPWRLDQLEV